jgi:hypothetical protein
MKLSREEEWLLILLSERDLTKEQMVSAIATADRRKKNITFLGWKLWRMECKGLLVYWTQYIRGQRSNNFYKITTEGRRLIEEIERYRVALYRWTP